MYVYIYQWPARYTPQANWGQSLMYQHTAEPYYKGHASFEEIAVSEYTYMCSVSLVMQYMLYNCMYVCVSLRVCIFSIMKYVLLYAVFVCMDRR